MVRVAGFLILFLVMVSCGGDVGELSGTTAQFRYDPNSNCANVEARLEVGGAIMISKNSAWSARTSINACGNVVAYRSLAYEGAPFPCGWAKGTHKVNVKCGANNLFISNGYDLTVTTRAAHRR